MQSPSQLGRIINWGTVTKGDTLSGRTNRPNTGKGSKGCPVIHQTLEFALSPLLLLMATLYSVKDLVSLLSSIKKKK